MAYISCVNKGTTYLVFEIGGLQYPVNNYSQFKIMLYKSGTLIGTYPWTESGSGSYAYKTISGLSSGSTYTAYGFATYNGTQYSIGDTSGTTDTGSIDPPPDPEPTTQLDTPIYSSYSRTQTSISITYDIVNGATSYSIDCYTGSGTYEGSSAGSSPSAEFDGLSPGTQYRFRCKAEDIYGEYLDSDWSSWKYITTLGGSIPPTPSSGVSISTRVEGGFDLDWGSSSGATSYTLRYMPYGGSYSTIDVSGTSYTLDGLQFGTSYYLSVRANNSYGSSSYTGENIGTTAPQTPSIYLQGTTSNSITISRNAMSGNWDYVRVERYSGTGTYIDYKDMTSGGNWYVTWTGLSAGVSYQFKATSHMSNPALDSVGYSNTVVVNASSRPSNWYWSYVIESGGNVFRTVVDGSTIIAYIMPATEWNDFTSTINGFRNYKGLGNYSFTTVYTDYSCTPIIVNQAVDAINQIGFNVSGVTSGEVPARVFNNMRDALNSIT